VEEERADGALGSSSSLGTSGVADARGGSSKSGEVGESSKGFSPLSILILLRVSSPLGEFEGESPKPSSKGNGVTGGSALSRNAAFELKQRRNHDPAFICSRTCTPRPQRIYPIISANIANGATITARIKSRSSLSMLIRPLRVKEITEFEGGELYEDDVLGSVL
jgi:hypothetical protein